jgi:hypothetical protein
MDLWLALRDEAQREQAIAQLLVMPHVAREDVDCMLFKAGIHDVRQRRALIAKVLGEPQDVDEDQDVLGTDVNFLRAYLSHSASTEGMDRFTQQALAQTDPRRLQTVSAALLDLIQGSDSPDRFHERFTLLSLVEVLQARFADFALQEGKKAIHRLSFNPFFVTKSTVDNLYWSFEIHRWVYLPSETFSERDGI